MNKNNAYFNLVWYFLYKVKNDIKRLTKYYFCVRSPWSPWTPSLLPVTTCYIFFFTPLPLSYLRNSKSTLTAITTLKC